MEKIALYLVRLPTLHLGAGMFFSQVPLNVVGVFEKLYDVVVGFDAHGVKPFGRCFKIYLYSLPHVLTFYQCGLPGD